MVIIVTLKDVANACEVSVSTVSRAFDKNSRISQPVRQRVLACAAELGYTPNLLARSLKSSRSMTIALIIPSFKNSFYIDVLQHIEIKLHQHGYRLLVMFIHKGITSERDCLETAVSAQVDGIIFFPRTCENQQYLESLKERIKVIQLFTAPYEQFDSVIINDEKGTEMGTSYLISHGHKRILYAGDTTRIAGFWRALEKANLSYENVFVLPKPITGNELKHAIEQFRPTAIFSIASTTEIVLQTIQELQLSVPNDISLLSYDDSRIISLMGLTAVSHNLDEVTDVLISQLLIRMSGDTDSPAKHMILEAAITERKSIRKLS